MKVMCTPTAFLKGISKRKLHSLLTGQSQCHDKLCYKYIKTLTIFKFYLVTHYGSPKKQLRLTQNITFMVSYCILFIETLVAIVSNEINPPRLSKYFKLDPYM